LADVATPSFRAASASSKRFAGDDVARLERPARREQRQRRTGAHAGERGIEHLAGLALPIEPQERLDQPGGPSLVARGDLGEPQKLLARLVEHPRLEVVATEVRAGRHEAGVDLERFAVMGRRVRRAILFVGQHAEAVVRVRQIVVDAARPQKERPRVPVVAACELGQAQVHEGLDEARVVLERDREARLGRREIALLERGQTEAVHLDGLGRERGRTGAAERKRRDEQNDDDGTGHGSPSARRQRSCQRVIMRIT
jgi:hypothetical protein